VSLHLIPPLMTHCEPGRSLLSPGMSRARHFGTIDDMAASILPEYCLRKKALCVCLNEPFQSRRCSRRFHARAASTTTLPLMARTTLMASVHSRTTSIRSRPVAHALSLESLWTPQCAGQTPQTTTRTWSATRGADKVPDSSVMTIVHPCSFSAPYRIRCPFEVLEGFERRGSARLMHGSIQHLVVAVGLLC
jgi:hypothetical protein